MQTSFDTQANGWRDDGTESGALRTELTRGNLVLIPLDTHSGFIEMSASGSGNIIAVTDGLSNRTGNQWLYLQLPDANSAVSISFRFNGRALGFCLATNYSPGTSGMTAQIDGVMHPFPPAPVLIGDPTNHGPGYGYHYYPIVDNLPDGVHQCRFTMVGADVNQIVKLFGIFVEERVGYRPAPTSAILANSAIVATASRQTFSALFSGNVDFTYLSAIHLANVTASDCLVTLDKNNVTFWREVISANKTREINFPLPAAINYNYGITCQTANAIQTSLWGYQL
jgi:hypothetical protein